jgi:hypothetical protein
MNKSLAKNKYKFFCQSLKGFNFKNKDFVER